MEKIKRGEIPLTRFYITDYIFDETITFIKCVLNNHELALKLGEALQTSPLTTIIWVDEELFREFGNSSSGWRLQKNLQPSI